MHFSLLLTAALTSVAVAAPIGSRTGSALAPRQSNNSGSTSTSTTNNSGALGGLGLTGGMIHLRPHTNLISLVSPNTDSPGSRCGRCSRRWQEHELNEHFRMQYVATYWLQSLQTYMG